MSIIADPQDAIDAPTISEIDARFTVLDCLEGRKTLAFGLDAEDWEEIILDEVSTYRARLALAVLSSDLYHRIRLQDRVVEAIHRRAEAWMAEADQIELDREGWKC